MILIPERVEIVDGVRESIGFDVEWLREIPSYDGEKNYTEVLIYEFSQLKEIDVDRLVVEGVLAITPLWVMDGVFVRPVRLFGNQKKVEKGRKMRRYYLDRSRKIAVGYEDKLRLYGLFRWREILTEIRAFVIEFDPNKLVVSNY